MSSSSSSQCFSLSSNQQLSFRRLCSSSMRLHRILSALEYNVTAPESLVTSSQSPLPSPGESTSPTPTCASHQHQHPTRAIARRLEKIRQWPMVFRLRRMGIRATRDSKEKDEFESSERSDSRGRDIIDRGGEQVQHDLYPSLAWTTLYSLG
jgi:hypothetical protein